jgi:hypothetical protein
VVEPSAYPGDRCWAIGTASHLLAWTSGSGIGDRLEPQHEPQEEIGEVIRRAVTAGDQEALELLHSGRLNEKGQSTDRGMI